MKFLKTAALVATCLLAPAAASALTYTFTDRRGTPAMTGASGVNLNGFLYDVTFYTGKTLDLFGVSGTNSFRPLDFRSKAEAEAAGQALQDQVFVDDPSGDVDKQYDSARFLTFFIPVRYDAGADESRSPIGVPDTDLLQILIPYRNAPREPMNVTRVFNDTEERLDTLEDGTQFESIVAQWATFELTGPVAPVPVPESALLLGAGLGALRLMRKRAA